MPKRVALFLSNLDFILKSISNIFIYIPADRGSFDVVFQ